MGDVARRSRGGRSACTPFFLAVGGDRLAKSKSGYGLVKLKSSPLPNQSPSQPTFQPSTSTPGSPLPAAKSMIFLDVGGGRAVLGARAQLCVVEVHVPPDADILARLEPADVAELVGLVEVEHQVVRMVEPGGIVGDDQIVRHGVVERRVADSTLGRPAPGVRTALQRAALEPARPSCPNSRPAPLRGSRGGCRRRA